MSAAIAAAFKAVDVEALDRALLLPNGCMRLMPADELRAFGTLPLIAWAYARARYQLVTIELIDYLRAAIDGRSVIEIGSGQGDIAHHLNIRGTDSAVQTRAELRVYYAALGQAVTDPPAFVERISAADAVAKYAPEVVVGAWVTQLWRPGDRHGSIYGVDEVPIIDAVERYIHVGNAASHASKRALVRVHAVERPAWLVSRSTEPAGNLIQIWGRR